MRTNDRIRNSEKRSNLRKAVLDIGTNSILLLIAEKLQSDFKVIYQDKEEPRLGQDFTSIGHLIPQAKERAALAISRLIEKAHGFGADEIRLIGTKVLCDAPDASEFIDDIREKSGMEIEIIGGEKEAQYSFEGGLYGLDIERRSILAVDIGGGSTEFAYLADDERLKLKSLPIGCVYLSEKFIKSIPTDERDYSSASDHVIGILKAELPVPDARIRHIIFTGGTVTSSAAAMLQLPKYDSRAVHGLRLSCDRLNRFAELVRAADLKKRHLIFHLNPQRTDIVVGGLIIWVSIMRQFAFDQMIISDGGVRFGVLLEMMKA